MSRFSKHTIISATLVCLAAGSPVSRRDTAPLPPVVSFNIGAGGDAILEYPWPIVRDGGGAGMVAGTYLINFSDTTTENENDLKDYGFYPFVSNSIASATAYYVSVYRPQSIEENSRRWKLIAWFNRRMGFILLIMAPVMYHSSGRSTAAKLPRITIGQQSGQTPISSLAVTASVDIQSLKSLMSLSRHTQRMTSTPR